MLSRTKETSELKVSDGPYLRNVIGPCLNELVHHPSAKDFFFTKLPFQQRFNHFLEVFYGKVFNDQQNSFHAAYYILILEIHSVLGNGETLEIPHQ